MKNKYIAMIDPKSYVGKIYYCPKQGTYKKVLLIVEKQNEFYLRSHPETRPWDFDLKILSVESFMSFIDRQYYLDVSRSEYNSALDIALANLRETLSPEIEVPN